MCRTQWLYAHIVSGFSYITGTAFHGAFSVVAGGRRRRSPAVILESNFVRGDFALDPTQYSEFFGRPLQVISIMKH